MPVAACPFDGPHHPYAAEARQQLLEQDSQFQPSQVRAQAVVHALTET